MVLNINEEFCTTSLCFQVHAKDHINRVVLSEICYLKFLTRASCNTLSALGINPIAKQSCIELAWHNRIIF